MSAKPLCFVLMPFGRKPDAGGVTIDFDAVYRDLIKPAIDAAGLEPIRADEEQGGGIIHKPMFERLILCDYAVADLTTANANVFYELGVRHAVRPFSTVMIFAEGARLPFDLAPLRAIPYRLTPAGVPADPTADQAGLVNRLREARDPQPDSPVFQLVEGWRTPEIDHVKTDVFRDRVRYAARMKERLAEARGKKDGGAALRAIEQELGPAADVESGVMIDLFLSYRDKEAWDAMIALAKNMSPPLAATVMVQEQLGLALNRAGQSERAEAVLTELLKRRGPSSETYGLLGRVYKDRWVAARNSGDELRARGLLDKAIEAYLRGFETDWRDAYPGVNALTLMEIRDPPDQRREQLRPVVEYAVERKIAVGEPDYWDFATRLELAVLGRDEARGRTALSDALAAAPAPWQAKTTVNNMRMIREGRARRQEAVPWALELEQVLGA
jgi:tetratricopeptide (TPR) repeat protein